MKQRLTRFSHDEGRLGLAGAFLGLIAAVAAAFPGPLWAQGTNLVTGFEVSESAFSPDGDGAQDSTGVILTLSEDSPSLAIVVFESDTVTVVDTLAAAGAYPAGTDTFYWSGTDSGGQPVPEGLYLVELTASGAAAGDTTITLPVAVDVTAPVLRILLSEPGIYTPGLMGTPQVYSVTLQITDSSPSFGLPTLEDQLSLEMYEPRGAIVTLDTFVNIVPPYDGEDGTYELAWDANDMQMVSDGFYRFKLELTDQAGHRASASDRANVDTDPPDVGFINIEAGEFLAVVPDSLYGWAWDRNGIDSLFVRYADTLSYGFIEDTVVSRDTTFFAVPLADLIPGEGKYKLGFRAIDAAAADTGWVSTPSLSFTVLRTAPSPPALVPFNGVWRTPEFTLDGTWSGGTEVVRIYRNDQLIDSVLTLVLDAREQDSLLHPVTLLAGLNRLTATAVDEAGNESGPSNEVRVQFVTDSGLFIPAPFGPDEEFHLNLSEPASRATLRIFDMSGELVVVLRDGSSSRNYAFAWNGLNGDGESVKKGPLVAVSQAQYDAGGQSDVVFREIFLFDPDKR